MSYQVNWEIRALDLTAGFLRDDPRWRRCTLGERQRARPPAAAAGVVRLRVAGPRRLQASRYRVFYTINEEQRVIQIDHVARLP